MTSWVLAFVRSIHLSIVSVYEGIGLAAWLTVYVHLLQWQRIEGKTADLEKRIRRHTKSKLKPPGYTYSEVPVYTAYLCIWSFLLSTFETRRQQQVRKIQLNQSFKIGGARRLGRKSPNNILDEISSNFPAIIPSQETSRGQACSEGKFSSRSTLPLWIPLQQVS